LLCAQALKARLSASVAATASELRVIFANILPLQTTSFRGELAALPVNARFR
jgi:hypothetical protein